MVASQEKALNMMRRILYKKLSDDGCTVGHTQRVIEISLSLGKEIGLSPDELEDLYWGAMLHDIGKIAVDPEILNKPGALTLEEYRHIMTHAILSLNIAKDMVNERVLEIISHHHDYYDGRGFNQTIAGEEIPLGARILALADAFDAMTSDRPYRAAMSDEKALVEIRRCRGTQFDPGVASAFLKMHLLPRPALQYAMSDLKENGR
jgi:putative nucleotidyltransferase with HDIG domain